MPTKGSDFKKEKMAYQKSNSIPDSLIAQEIIKNPNFKDNKILSQDALILREGAYAIANMKRILNKLIRL